jgi:hypothetical protein
MRKLLTIVLLFNALILLAANITRSDAIEYYKRMYKNQKKSILMSTINRDNINPDYSIEKQYSVINLCWEDTKEDDLKYIQSFPEVKAITLSEAIKLKDRDLKYLPNLKSLDLSKTNINGEGFKDLNNLPSLKDIDLTGAKVTDEGIQELKKFKKLKRIILCKTKVTQKGIDRLKKELSPKCYITKVCEGDTNQE